MKIFAKSKKNNLLYFFMAWNTFGLVVYGYFKNRQENLHPDWDKLTSGIPITKLFVIYKLLI